MENFNLIKSNFAEECESCCFFDLTIEVYKGYFFYKKPYTHVISVFIEKNKRGGFFTTVRQTINNKVLYSSDNIYHSCMASYFKYKESVEWTVRRNHKDYKCGIDPIDGNSESKAALIRSDGTIESLPSPSDDFYEEMLRFSEYYNCSGIVENVMTLDLTIRLKRIKEQSKLNVIKYRR